MNKTAILLYNGQQKLRKFFFKVFCESIIKSSFESCGKNVHIAEKCDFKGIKNISIGDDSSIGMGSILWTTRAKIKIADKVFTGPNITMITGNHTTNIVGRFMADVTDNEKQADDDEDIIIKRDVWIGANSIILKGVTINEGCVIAAASVVTKDTESYGVYAGNPAKRIKGRFEENELLKHKQIIKYN